MDLSLCVTPPPPAPIPKQERPLDEALSNRYYRAIKRCFESDPHQSVCFAFLFQGGKGYDLRHIEGVKIVYQLMVDGHLHTDRELEDVIKKIAHGELLHDGSYATIPHVDACYQPCDQLMSMGIVDCGCDGLIVSRRWENNDLFDAIYSEPEGAYIYIHYAH